MLHNVNTAFITQKAQNANTHKHHFPRRNMLLLLNHLANERSSFRRRLGKDRLSRRICFPDLPATFFGFGQKLRDFPPNRLQRVSIFVDSRDHRGLGRIKEDKGESKRIRENRRGLGRIKEDQ